MMNNAHDPAARPERNEFLTIALAVILSDALHLTGLVNGAKAILVGWPIALLVGYWVPPRPKLRFRLWLLERMILVIGFYLAVLRIPALLRSVIPMSLAYGIPIGIFVVAFMAWLHYREWVFGTEDNAG